MAKRLWTTTALAVVVAMLVGACASSTTSPSPSAAASAAASESAAAPSADASAEASVAPSGAPAAALSDGPDRLHRAGHGARRRQAVQRQASHDPDAVDRWRRRQLRRRGRATSRRRPGSTSCRRASPRSTRSCCAPASRVAPHPTWPCSRSRRPWSSTAIAARRPTSPRSWIRQSSTPSSRPVSARCSRQWRGGEIWGVPYKVDVKSTIWYPIKAFEAAGYAVPTTWDELKALSAKIVADGNGSPVVPRHPRRGRDRLDRHRLARGRHASNGRHRGLQPLDHARPEVRLTRSARCPRRARRAVVHGGLRQRWLPGDHGDGPPRKLGSDVRARQQLGRLQARLLDAPPGDLARPDFFPDVSAQDRVTVAVRAR